MMSSNEVSPPASAGVSATSGLICVHCGRACRSAAGLKCHLRRCQPESVLSPSVSVPAEPSPRNFVCDHCGRGFSSQRGRSLHVKSAHPAAYFAERSRLAPSRTTWTTQEDALLRRCASAVLQASGPLALRALAREVGIQFPTRSVEAVFKRLSKLDKDEPLFTPPVSLSAVGPSSSSPSPAPPAVCEPDQVEFYRTSLLHSAVKLLTDSPCQALASGDLLSVASDLLMGEAQLSDSAARLDAHAAVVFPRRWRPGVNRRPTVVARPTASHKLRRAQYAEVQARLAKNAMAGAQFILSGDWRNAPCPEAPLPPGTLEFWRELTERPSEPDQRPIQPPTTVAWEILEPITATDVTGNLRLMQGSAAGIDGLSAKDLLKWSPAAIAGYLNIILAIGHLPAQHCTCRTTLVPKVSTPTLPSEYRPIAVVSPLPTARFQFGFQERDGTAEATSLLHGMLRYAVSAPRSIAVAVLDVAKAFDSVNHGTLLRAAEANGAPPLLTTLLASTYSRATTYILDAEVRCQRGVRQGDPLSPLLFNCALSEALSYSDRQLGFDLTGVTVDSIAYADDLVLFAESPHRLQQRLDGLANGLSLAGMVLNSAKCLSFYVQALGKEKSACLCPCDVSIGGSVLRSLGPTDTFKYLGVPFSYRGKVTVGHRSALSGMLEELTRAPLKPQQRITLLKRHCVPKLLHKLVLGAVHRNTLKRLDVQVRQSVRRWLKLPADTPTSFLHAPIVDGGLGIPCLSVLVPFAKRRRLDSVLSSAEPVVRAAATMPSAISGLRLAAQPVRMGHTVLASKDDARNYWRNELYNSADGRPLAQFAKSACASHWLSSPARVFPWLYLRGIQLRAGVLSTKSRRSRGAGITDVLCRGQCGQRETLFHILQCCQVTHRARVWRHNLAMKLLASKLIARGHEVLVEPHIPEGQTFKKPDIVVCADDRLTVVDVAVADEDLMDTVYAGKTRHYSTVEVEGNLRRILGKPADFPVSHAPAIFSSRGALSPRSEASLKLLGLSKFDLSDLCLAVIRGSLKAYDVYVRGAGNGENQ
ncbi:hypothetical protein AAHC03_026817 [Spirometra sp. Aus1]